MNDELIAIKESLLMMNGGPYILVAIILLASWLSYLFAGQIILRLVRKIFKQTATHLDDILIERGVLNRLAYGVPLLVLYSFSDLLPDYSYVIQQCLSALLVIVFILVINAVLDAINDIYSRTKFVNQLNIKSYLQISKLILNILAGIVVIAILIDKSPIYLLSGIGALTAVLLLIFKDTILSFVASIQIHSNDLFKIGDWLEAPQFAADGDVIDIALHTVKIQNWDKTISIIPSHKLIASSFKNWRGMSQSGARRIKRAIFIDVSSIRFQTQDEVDHFTRFALLKDYVGSKEQELADYNAGLATEVEAEVNRRRLTNVGTFRAYAYNYLKNHPRIHEGMTLIVRQLSPGPEGLPLEIYCFTSTTEWAVYEDIQSDIFDHLLAAVPRFGLKVFQEPTGAELAQALSA